MARLRLVVSVLTIILLAPLASATTVAPDLLLIEINLNWTIPWLSGPVNVSGSNLWQNGVGYVPPIARSNERWIVTGTGLVSGAYIDIGFFGWEPSLPLLINLEAFLNGLTGVTGGFQHFVMYFGESSVLLPGDYPIDRAHFLNESGPLSTYGTWFAESGYQRVSAVQEPAMSLLMVMGLVVGAVLLRRAHR
jgi:hypothetical protein